MSCLVQLLLIGAFAGEFVEVRVEHPDGTPAAKTRVVLEVGLARFDLAENFQRWSAVKKFEAETDGAGRVRFEELPPGARVTVFARLEQQCGLVEGDPGAELVLRLQPTGGLAGKLAGKESLRSYSVHAVGPRGFERKEVRIDGEGFTLLDVPAGEIELEVRLGNWIALSKTFDVKPGKPTKVPTLKIGGEFLTGADPLVDARKVRLVGADKKPLSGTKFAWSAPWADGWCPANDEGEIQLVGGGVAIGPPPFILRLDSVGIDQECRYLGKLLGVQRGTALIEASQPLEPLSVSVTRGGTRLGEFQIFAVSGGDEPRVWHAKIDGGVATFLVPQGELRLVVGAPDGKLHEERFVKPAGEVEHACAVDGG